MLSAKLSPAFVPSHPILCASELLLLLAHAELVWTLGPYAARHAELVGCSLAMSGQTCFAQRALFARLTSISTMH